MKAKTHEPLYPPRAMRLPQAAHYLSMSQTSFVTLVQEGAMPAPTKIKGMTVWDRLDIDMAFDELKLKSDDPRNSVEELLATRPDDTERARAEAKKLDRAMTIEGEKPKLTAVAKALAEAGYTLDGRPYGLGFMRSALGRKR